MTERGPMHFPESWVGFGPAMGALRNDRERRFAWAYLMGAVADLKANGTQAARDAGYPDNGLNCRVRASELLHREDVLAAISEVSAQHLRGLVGPAVAVVGNILAEPKHQDRRKAAEMVLDRTGHGARSTIDVNVSATVTLNHTDSALEDLRRLRAMGVPRDKLIETFGYSGLERYERMLASQAKVIEGEVVK